MIHDSDSGRLKPGPGARRSRGLQSAFLAAPVLLAVAGAPSAVSGNEKSPAALARKLEALDTWSRGGFAEALGPRRKGAGDASPCRLCDGGKIACGGSRQGALEEADCRLDEGSLVETWTFEVAEKQRYDIRLESAAFDAFVFLADRNCLVLAQSDGCEGQPGARDACLSLELPPGTYHLAANSFAAGASGAYRLVLGCEDPPELSFRRGDCNGDGQTKGVADAVALLTANFVGGVAIRCRAACDVNGDGSTAGVADAIALLTANFVGGVLIPAPFPDCGPSDRTSDAALGCEAAGAGCG
jgi:hypothetical protein